MGTQKDCMNGTYSSAEDMKRMYKKSDIDFGYVIDRKRKNSPRYAKIGRVWKQKNPGESNQAVILCAGDLMCEPRMSEAAYFDGEYDFMSCFKYIKPALAESDLVLANLETMVTDLVPYASEIHSVNHHTGKRFHCNAPLSYLKALRYAGFDGFVMANNHSADGGYEGLVDTIDNVDDYEFMRTGAFKHDKEERTLIVDVNGIRLGILSYTEHINRGIDAELFTAQGCEVMFNRFEEDKLKRDIADAKANGAEFIVCYMHVLGKEYTHEVLPSQRKMVQLVADAGADCVMCSHTHSIQEYEAVATADGRKVPVVHSLGNFITSDNTSMITRKSVVFRLKLKKVDGKVSIEDESYIPCRVIEDSLYSGYKVFPTQSKYRGNRAYKLLDDAQEEISQIIGQLKVEGENA